VGLGDWLKEIKNSNICYGNKNYYSGGCGAFGGQGALAKIMNDEL
jgi:hypothetical protein